MTERRQFTLAHDEARRRAVATVLAAPVGYSVTVEPPKRSGDQNSAMWPILQAFSEQLQWPVNGRMVTMTDAEWKDVLSAAFHNETARLAMGLNGGVVLLGQRTSKMSKPKFSEWLDFLHAVAAERGVALVEEMA